MVQVKQEYVICCFPGVGKTTMVSDPEYPNVVDLDRPDIKDWDAYVDLIKEQLAAGKQILIPSWEGLRKAVVKANIDLILVYPDESLKDEYMKRYADRNDCEMFKQVLTDNFEKFVGSMREQTDAAAHLVIDKPDTYLADILISSMVMVVNQRA